MADIEVTATAADGQRLGFDVRVVEPGSSSTHQVTLSRRDLDELAGDAAPEEFVRRCFRFLLEREPKEAILPRFDIAVIARYFPEFREAISTQR